MKPLAKLIALGAVTGTFLISGAIIGATSYFSTAKATQDTGSAEARQFVETLGSRVLSVLDNRALNERMRYDRYLVIFDEAFDSKRIGDFALGKYGHKVTGAKREEFYDLFRKYVTGIYADRFADYAGESFAVTGHQRLSEDRDEVRAEIRRPGSDPKILVFRTIETPRGRKIYDVFVDGLSLLIAKREEVTSIIGREDVNALLDKLRNIVQLAETRG